MTQRFASNLLPVASVALPEMVKLTFTFGLALGNPPWVKVEREEGGVMDDRNGHAWHFQFHTTSESSLTHPP